MNEMSVNELKINTLFLSTLQQRLALNNEIKLDELEDVKYSTL